jgi:hypothetical protein
LVQQDTIFPSKTDLRNYAGWECKKEGVRGRWGEGEMGRWYDGKQIEYLRIIWIIIS